MVDPPGCEALAFLMPTHLADDAEALEFVEDEIAFGVGVGIGRVGDLKGEFGQRESGVPRARADPERGRVERRLVGIEPEFRRVQRLLARSRLSAQKRM